MSLAITEALLTAAGASPKGAALYAGPLAASAARRGVTSTSQVENLLTQALHESSALTCVSEDLTYRSAAWLAQVFPSHFASAAAAQGCVGQPVKLGNLVYGAIGKAAGGYAARGLGLGMLTGDANQGAYAADVGRSLAEARAYMLTPEGAADSAVWYFVWRHCGAPADRGDITGVRRLWAGSLIGLPQVQTWFAQVCRAANARPGVAPGRPGPVSHPAVPAAPPQQTADDLNAAQLDTINHGA